MKRLCIIFLSLLFIFNSCDFESDSDSDTASNSSTTNSSSSNSNSSSSGSSSNSSSSSSSSGTSTASSSTSATGSTFISSGIIYLNLTDLTVSDDNSTWTEITTKKTKLLNETAKVDFTSDDTDTATDLIRVNITNVESNVSVYITGSMTSGGVKIQTPQDYETGVYLDSVSIKSSDYPCIELTKGGSVSLFIEGTNSLIDGRTYGTGYGEEYSTSSGDTYTDDDGNEVSCTVVKATVTEGSDAKGTLFSKGDMTISGSGSLSVTQSYKNCIATKGILTIQSGVYTLTSKGKNGLYADQGVVVDGGTITFEGTGEVSTSACRKTNGIKTDTDEYTDSYIKINDGTISVTAYSGKGFASSYVYVTGGSSVINATGVSGFAKDNKKSGTYYDGDGVKCSGTISCAPEGIEAEYAVNISGGEVSITCNDDGINVSNKGGQLNISDGYVYVYAKNGDGLDSNGDISISGGYIVSYAPTGSEDALDWADSQMDGYNGACKITGGYIAGLSGAVESPSSVSNAGVIILSNAVSSGSTIAVGSSTSDIGFAFKVPSGFSATNLFICSPKLTGSSYTVYKNCTVSGGSFWNGLYTEMPTLSSSGTTSTVSLSNHIYSAASGGMGGGSMGGGSSMGGKSGGGNTRR